MGEKRTFNSRVINWQDLPPSLRKSEQVPINGDLNSLAGAFTLAIQRAQPHMKPEHTSSTKSPPWRLAIEIAEALTERQQREGKPIKISKSEFFRELDLQLPKLLPVEKLSEGLVSRTLADLVNMPIPAGAGSRAFMLVSNDGSPKIYITPAAYKPAIADHKKMVKQRKGVEDWEDYVVCPNWGLMRLTMVNGKRKLTFVPSTPQSDPYPAKLTRQQAQAAQAAAAGAPVQGTLGIPPTPPPAAPPPPPPAPAPVAPAAKPATKSILTGKMCITCGKGLTTIASNYPSAAGLCPTCEELRDLKVELGSTQQQLQTAVDQNTTLQEAYKDLMQKLKVQGGQLTQVERLAEQQLERAQSLAKGHVNKLAGAIIEGILSHLEEEGGKGEKLAEMYRNAISL